MVPRKKDRVMWGRSLLSKVRGGSVAVAQCETKDNEN